MSLWPLKQRSSAPMVMALDAQRLAWRQRGGANAGQTAVVDWAHDPGAAVNSALGLTAATASTSPAPPQSVDLIVAGPWVKHWLQTPPTGVASFQELQLVARARCAHLFGHTPADWTVTGDWHTTHAFVCAALSASTHLAFEQAFSAQGIPVRWHTTWGLITSRRAPWLPASGWVAARSPQQVVVWHCTRGDVDALATLPLHAEQDCASAAAAVLQHIQVQAAQAEHLAPDTPGWLDLAAPNAPAPSGTRLIKLKAPHTKSVATEAEVALALAPLLAHGALQ